MSVLLTASKKAVKCKSAKHKVKKTTKRPPPANNHHANDGSKQFDPTPPLSTARTSVWHWELDGEPTTVMLRKDNNQVWCNGEVIETATSFADGEHGGVIDFIIINGLGKCHEARIRRELDQGKMAHHLYVKGFMILEHTSPGSAYKSLQGQSSTEDSPFEGPPPIVDYMEPTGFDTFRSSNGNNIDPQSFLPPPPYYEEPFVSDKKND